MSICKNYTEIQLLDVVLYKILEKICSKCRVEKIIIRHIVTNETWAYIYFLSTSSKRRTPFLEEGCTKHQKNQEYPKKLRLVQKTLSNRSNKLQQYGVAQKYSRWRRASTDLFNLVITRSKIQTTALIYRHIQQCVAYTDDVILLARPEKELERVLFDSG